MNLKINKAKPKAILFDWDNTLADSWPAITLAYNTMFAAMNTSFTNDQIQEQIHKSARDALPKLFGNQWQRAEAIYQATYLKHRYETLSLMPHAIDVLDLLKKDGSIYLAIVSNKIGKDLRTEIKHLGLSGYFNKEVGSLDAKFDKPSKEAVILALGSSKINLDENVWFIGDTIVDVECALNSECTPFIFGDADIKTHREQHLVNRLNNWSEFLILLKSFLSV